MSLRSLEEEILPLAEISLFDSIHRTFCEDWCDSKLPCCLLFICQSQQQKWTMRCLMIVSKIVCMTLKILMSHAGWDVDRACICSGEPRLLANSS